MSTLRNKVQLIGNVGQDPELINLEDGKKLTRFSLATNEFFKNDDGIKVKNTHWHQLVAWGRLAETISAYATKGKEIAVEGKLISRSYLSKEGEQRNITEVIVQDLVLLGGSNGNTK